MGDGENGTRGILVREWGAQHAVDGRDDILLQLGAADLAYYVEAKLGVDACGRFLNLRLSAEAAKVWAPACDTLQLSRMLQLDTVTKPHDLIREILVAMLMGPVAFEFPSAEELLSAIRIRRNIVLASRNTMLAFHTSMAERPEDCWRYDQEYGFVIRPGASLIAALTKATQPAASGPLYTFSCYRASEYIMVLGIAQELERCNQLLLRELEGLWTRRPIRSGQFHDVFLREQGSMEAPLPPRYFVPGDRTWFRNPDEASAEASGFEGSWVIYLGGGLFTNFWKRDQPYTLEQKCLEIYHWRHGLYHDDQGEACIDEDKVAFRVQASLSNADEMARILAMMQRYREPRGVYTDAGGCLDTTREFARWVRPETTDMVLPAY